jgi:hypothetical protein
MARRRKKSSTRRVYSRPKTASYRRKRRSGSSKVKPFDIDAMLYGAARAPLAQLMAPLANKLPIIGGLGDEVAVGGLNWLLAKNGSGKVKSVAMKGLIVENARAGEVAGSLILSKLGGMTGSSSSNDGYVY